MKKLFSLLFIFLFSLCSTFEVSAITLKGRVSYQSKEVKEVLDNVDKVRKEAFANVQDSIDISPHQKHFKDPFHRVNKSYAKNKVSYTLGDFGRFITHFSDGGYGIRYDDGSNIWYHYTSKGKLDFVKYYTNSSISYNYNIDGKLIAICISKDKIQYAFDTNGKLISIWIGSYEYDPDGNIILERW